MLTRVDDQETFEQVLTRKIWITSGARYKAAKRLMAKHSLSTAAISFLSIYVLGINLMQVFSCFSLSPNQKELYSFVSIVASLFILVLTLLEATQNYQLRSDRLRNCARQIKILHNKLIEFTKSDADETDKQKKIHDIGQEYNAVIVSNTENHDDIDYNLFRAENRKEFDIGVFEAFTMKLWAFIVPNILYIGIIVFPPILLIYILTRMTK
jgi:hypothetical protein